MEGNKTEAIKQEVKAPWLKYYGKMKSHLEYPDISVYHMIEKTAINCSNNIAYRYFGTTSTYKKLMKDIDKCARSFKNMGIKKEDTVTICMPNTPEAVICFYALNKIGAIASMIHPLSSENEIKYYLNISESKMLIAIDLAFEKIKNIIKDTKVEKTVIVSVKDSMPFLLKIGFNITKGGKIKKVKTNEKIISWKRFIRRGQNYKNEITAKTNGSAPAAILYSGGTTGTSKGIILSNLNFNALAMQGIEACGSLKAGDSILAIMPIFHGFGLGICIHTCLYYGITCILLPQFSSKTFDKLLTKYKPNIIAGVPTLYEALLKNERMKGIDLSFITCAISGGDSLSVSLKKKIDEFFVEHNAGIQVREGYGLTECVTGSCLTPINLYKEQSIGIPYPDTYYKIVRQGTQTEALYGEIGEIVLCGPTVMLGYLKNEQETKQALQKHSDGRVWLHTGDLGYMDQDGFIYFKQRLKRMIVSSGYNIYPQQIENIIDGHPSVLMSTVIGVEHLYKMQVPKAFVVLKNGIVITEEIKKSIYELCEKNLSKYSMPYEIEYREELPKTLVGKIAYTKLLEEENDKLNKKCDFNINNN